jgi:hypothetical protein
VDIGRPQRIIEVEPLSLPLPETLPDLEPSTPEPSPAEPSPAERDRSRAAS